MYRHETLARSETFEGRPTDEACRMPGAKRGAFLQQHFTFPADLPVLCSEFATHLTKRMDVVVSRGWMIGLLDEHGKNTSHEE